ncbi:UNVERIFIED_CONTAM: hypothetical protein FKN15_062836 [Acipenser sinensis]
MGSADNAEPMQAAPAERPDVGKEPPQKQEPPRAPEASVGSADNADPMQVAPARGSEGVEEHPQPEKELPQASLSCGNEGFGPRAATEGDEETPPEAESGSAEPELTLVSGARKGEEEPERAEGGALKADPLPEEQRGQETGPRHSIEGPVPITEGAIPHIKHYLKKMENYNKINISKETSVYTGLCAYKTVKTKVVLNRKRK